MTSSTIVDRRTPTPWDVYDSSETSLPASEDTPFEVVQGIQEQTKTGEVDEANATRERLASVKKIQAEFQDERRKLFGADNYERFRRFITDREESLAESLGTMNGPEATDEARNQVRHQHKQEVLDFLREMKIDMRQLQSQNESANRRIAEVAFPLPAQPEGRVPLSHTSGVHFYPPYPISGGATHQTHSGGFTFTGFYHGKNYSTGSSGGTAQFENWAPPSDLGFAESKRRSFYGVEYDMPSPGRVVVWLSVVPGFTDSSAFLGGGLAAPSASFFLDTTVTCEFVKTPPWTPSHVTGPHIARGTWSSVGPIGGPTEGFFGPFSGSHDSKWIELKSPVIFESAGKVLLKFGPESRCFASVINMGINAVASLGVRINEVLADVEP